VKSTLHVRTGPRHRITLQTVGTGSHYEAHIRHVRKGVNQKKKVFAALGAPSIHIGAAMGRMQLDSKAIVPVVNGAAVLHDSTARWQIRGVTSESPRGDKRR
jgi:hypothetical protein